MIKEENISRLSDEKRKEILADDGKLGLYKINTHSNKWFERVYVTKTMSLHWATKKINYWGDYHEWQSPPEPKEQPPICSNCHYTELAETHPNQAKMVCNSCHEFSRYERKQKQEKSCENCSLWWVHKEGDYVIHTKTPPTEQKQEKSCGNCDYKETGRLTHCNHCKFLSKWRMEKL